MSKVGLEDLNIYGSTLALELSDLAVARGKDPQTVADDYLIERRSVMPLWEDVITLAANAAAPLLEGRDKEEIGLLVVGTESSVDFGKPISTNLLELLGLPTHVRNFETKHACYSGLAAMTTALSWVKSGLNRGRKALVICSDFSREHLRMKEEFVLGSLSAALLISDQPRIIEYEFDAWGTWSHNVYDTFRPTAIKEVGNNEVSLFSYLDALEGSFADYQQQLGKSIDIDQYFRKLVFHTPFAGMAFQAYRTLCRVAKRKSRAQLSEDFDRYVRPALAVSQQVGSCYGASNVAGLASMILNCEDLREGDRIGHFAYGSGSIGEFYSARVVAGARAVLQRHQILQRLQKRQQVQVADYESLELQRMAQVDLENFTPARDFPAGLYQQHYQGKKLCVLQQVERFFRSYGWS